jgi:hypothetical protein
VLEKLRSFLSETTSRQQTIQLAGKTRWDSWHMMISGALKVRQELVVLQQKGDITEGLDFTSASNSSHKLEQISVNNNNLNTFSSIFSYYSFQDILAEVRKISKMVQGEEYVSMAMIPFAISQLKQFLDATEWLDDVQVSLFVNF